MKHGNIFRYIFFMSCCVVFLPCAALAEPVNLLSLQEGCQPVVVPPTYAGWDAQNMLDDGPMTGWASEKGAVMNNVFVFEMVAEATLERFEFDTAHNDTPGSAAKDISIEVSRISAKEGFEQILQASLENSADGQKYEVSKKLPARWVRLTIATNYGSPDYSEIFSLRGFGEKPAIKMLGAISGTYATNYSNFHVRQQGTALTGCYEYSEGLLDGAIEGRVMKITWRESGGKDRTGPAVMVYSEDGQTFKGYWWVKGSEKEAPSVWNGTKTSKTVGTCPHWTGSLGGELKRQLDISGRARVYGIRFALNSATIEQDSLPILAEVLALLKIETSLKLSIEGHTDSTGSADRNATLSQQRAESVKAHLVAGGIVADRLSSSGFGASAPLADNGTELGRSQNRRVELVRK
jgi:outer membrane protein OmpA-like peptidoglycan-associated protein